MTPPARKWLLDLAALGLVLVLGFAAGFQHLSERRRDRGTGVVAIRNMFGRAVMIAAGRGNVNPRIEAVPGLAAFLHQQSDSFDPALIPSDFPVSEESVEEYHRYLVYTVALVWRIFGISWRVIEICMALLLGVTAGLAYGVFRLGMGRGLSALGAVFFAASPPVLVMLPRVRDFSKAPFMLGVILLLGVLITRPLSARRTLALSGLVGCVIGIGMGFRQDLLIAVPPAFLVILISVFRSPGLTLKGRITSLALFLACFLVTGAPMLMRMEGGANPYHPVMQGFSSAHRENAGMCAAVYEPLSCGDDNYVFATACDYRRRHLAPLWPHMGFNTPRDVETERAWILDVFRLFPADCLARVYACVFRTIRNGDAYAPTQVQKAFLPRWPAKLYASFAWHMNRFGLCYAGLLLLLLSLHSLFEAGMVLLFLLYFCGYISLQCEFRHAFHLSFVPFWIVGFLLNTACLLARPGSRGRIRAELVGSKQRAAIRAGRTGLFALAAALLLVGPLWAARVWQGHTVDRMLEKYAEAKVDSLPVEKEALGDWVLFRMAASPPQRVQRVAWRAVVLGVFAHAMPIGLPGEAILWRACRGWFADRPMEYHVDSYYLAADLAASTRDRALVLKYTSANPLYNDFTQLVMVKASPPGASSVRYFFPVYEIRIGGQRNTFLGIALPREDVEDFRGLYAVRRGQDFYLPLNVSLPTPWRQAAHYETINWALDWTRYRRAETRGAEAMAEAEAEQGRGDSAIALLRAGFAMKPSMQLLEQILKLQEGKGDVAGVLGTCGRMIALAPGEHCMYREVDRFLEERCTPRQRADAWRGIGDAYPDFAPGFVLLGRAREALNDLEGAEEAYAAAMAKAPDVLQAICFAGDVPLGAEPPRRLRFWERMAGQHPESASVHGELGNVRFDVNDLEGAAQAYARAAAIRPDNASMSANLGRAQFACGDYTAAVETLQRTLTLAPDMTYLRHDLVDALLRVGRPEAAAREAELYERLGNKLNPEVRARLDEAVGKALP